MSDAMRQAVDELRAKVSELAKDIRGDPRMQDALRQLAVLNGMEQLIGESPTTLGDLLDLESQKADSKPSLAPDEFHLLEPLEAAKRYLRLVGKPARTLDEIVAAITTHGGRVPSTGKLKTQLTRSTYQVAKVGKDRWGLAEWYKERKQARRSSGADAGEKRADEEVGQDRSKFEDSNVTTEDYRQPSLEAEDRDQARDGC